MQCNKISQFLKSALSAALLSAVLGLGCEKVLTSAPNDGDLLDAPLPGLSN